MSTHLTKEIGCDEISAGDLREELASGADARCYRIVIYDDAGLVAEPEAAQALYDVSSGRLGIAWGAYASWADIGGLTIEAAVSVWLDDPEEWDSRN